MPIDELGVVYYYSRNWIAYFVLVFHGSQMSLNDSLWVAGIPALLILFGLVPSQVANGHIVAMRRASIGASVVGFVLSMVAAVWLVVGGLRDGLWLRSSGLGSFGLGVYYDAIAAVMLVLIQFIGCVIIAYSLRYLAGEATQGRFMRWICFTLGAVSLLVISQNLMMFAAAWVMTSFGLHQLLTHYADRRSALMAARKKFLISRLGDCFLIAALALTYKVFGTLDFTNIFLLAESMKTTGDGLGSEMLIGPLFVLGAMTKSAQFPFHSWLPDTMETPTPVSALMHAGIINAGGFLVIRLSPLISISPISLDFLAVLGAGTAIFGAIVMLTQTSVKRSLAYSTIAQMGFMMLQCGLGAYSAALLHLVGHSLYKAYAFLSTGSVLEAAAARQSDDVRARGFGEGETARPLAFVLVAISVSTIFCLASAAFWGVRWEEKPGAVLLGLVLILATANAVWRSMLSGRSRVIVASMLGGFGITSAYFAGYRLMDMAVATTASSAAVELSAFQMGLTAMIGICFIIVFAFQLGFVFRARPEWGRSLYVAASNGFYFDITAQRIVDRIWPARARDVS
jgi:NAD(P)H-quinone oxidoreductase subunit 5